jgi:hypothetical protein
MVEHRVLMNQKKDDYRGSRLRTQNDEGHLMIGPYGWGAGNQMDLKVRLLNKAMDS